MKSLLYFLFSKNKKPLYQDDNGMIQEGSEDLKKPDGQPANLKSSPEGWKDTLIKYARNIQYWGVFRSYTAPMKFVKDGGNILHYLRWTLGVEAICYFGIMRLDRTQLPYKYENFYLSEVNFAKHKNTQRGITVEALEGGLSKLLKSKESTVYEIHIDTDTEHINVNMDGMEFDFSRSFSIMGGQACYGTDLFVLGLVETAREGNAGDVRFQDLQPSTTEPYPNELWFIESELARSIRVRGFISIYFDKTVGFDLSVQTNQANGDPDPQYELARPGVAIAAGTNRDFPFDVTIPVPANGKLNTRIFGGSPSDATTQFTVTGGEFIIEYVYRHPASYVKGLYPYRLLEKIVDKMTEGQFGVKSDWLSAKKDLCITSGDALRGIVTDDTDPDNPVKGAVIKTSLLEFFKSFNRFGAGLSIEGIRMSVDDKLVIEPIGYFFPNTVSMDLGVVSKAELSEADDLMFNKIKVGYQEKNYSDANGRYEMNQGQEWTTPITRIVKELDLISPYRADAFGAELLRINYDQKKTSDSESDNDTFFLNIETEAQTDTVPDPDIVYYNLYRPAYSDVTGLPHWESAFNTELTPHKSLLSNGPFIRSVMDLMDTSKLTMASADKNSDFSTTLAGVTVLEKEDIQIGSLGAPLFRPVYITFTTKVPVNVMALIKANPYGKVKFTAYGEVYYGFLFDGGIKVGMQDTQVWKVLSAPENNFMKFNRNG